MIPQKSWLIQVSTRLHTWMISWAQACTTLIFFFFLNQKANAELKMSKWGTHWHKVCPEMGEMLLFSLLVEAPTPNWSPYQFAELAKSVSRWSWFLWPFLLCFTLLALPLDSLTVCFFGFSLLFFVSTFPSGTSPVLASLRVLFSTERKLSST